MPMYLESLDGSQTYLADLYSRKCDLVDGQVYSPEQLGFVDWLKTAGAQHKPPQKTLKAIWYGPKE